MHGALTYPEFLATYLDPFEAVHHRYDRERGFIAWRLGTGSNVELLHIRTFAPGKGYGRELLYRMLDAIQVDPPYHSIFGFTRVGNAEARAFYGALGFELQAVRGLYRDGEAVLFWQSYAKLLRAREAYADHLRCET